MVGKLLILTGPAGSGKSSVCRQLDRLIKENRMDWAITNAGELFVEEMGKAKAKTPEAGKVAGHDDVRKTSAALQSICQDNVFTKIRNMVKITKFKKMVNKIVDAIGDVVKGYKTKMAKEYNLIVDTHAFVPNETTGFLAGLPLKQLSKFKGIPMQLVLLRAQAENVQVQLTSDGSRPDRDMHDIETIKYYQEVSLAYMSACSVIANAPLRVVDNPHTEDKSKIGFEAAQSIILILRAMEKMYPA